MTTRAKQRKRKYEDKKNKRAQLFELIRAAKPGSETWYLLKEKLKEYRNA